MRQHPEVLITIRLPAAFGVSALLTQHGHSGSTLTDW
jgi:hypothetical protein